MDQKILMVINLLASTSIAWACLCRLNVSSVQVMPTVRAHYVLLLSGAIANGFQGPLFGQLPTTGGTVLAVGLAVGLVIGRSRWKNGPPTDVCNPKTGECRLDA